MFPDVHSLQRVFISPPPFTDQLSWSAALLLVTRVYPVYLVEGLVIVVLVLLKWKVVAILENGCGVQGQNYVAWLQGSKMSVGGW